MSFRVITIAAAFVAVAPSVVGAAPAAQTAPAAQAAPVASQADPTGAHAAIAQAQERLAEIDATITVLQEDADAVDGAAKQKAHDAVAALRAIRDTYRKELDGVLAQGRQMTAAQLAAVRTALTAPWTQFEQSLDQDVSLLKLGVAQRKAIVEARIRAEQTYWQGVIADLQTSATNLTAEQRAAIDARISAVRARAEATQARLTRLAHVTQTAWSALKQGFVASRQTFDDAYRGH